MRHRRIHTVNIGFNDTVVTHPNDIQRQFFYILRAGALFFQKGKRLLVRFLPKIDNSGELRSGSNLTGATRLVIPFVAPKLDENG